MLANSDGTFHSKLAIIGHRPEIVVPELAGPVSYFGGVDQAIPGSDTVKFSTRTYYRRDRNDGFTGRCYPVYIDGLLVGMEHVNLSSETICEAIVAVHGRLVPPVYINWTHAQVFAASIPEHEYRESMRIFLDGPSPELIREYCDPLPGGPWYVPQELLERLREEAGWTPAREGWSTVRARIDEVCEEERERRKAARICDPNPQLPMYDPR